MTIGLTIFSIYKLTNNIIEIKKYDFYDIYYGANIDENTKNSINKILNYIEENEKQGYNVKILSYMSNLYMNILNRNNGIMDLPFYGNLGIEGEDGLIEEVKKLKNTKLLILKDDELIIQESEKVRKFISDNYEKVDEIEQFNIYYVN